MCTLKRIFGILKGQIMEQKELWKAYLSKLDVGEHIEIEHLEFSFAPGNTADRIICLDKLDHAKFVLSVQIPKVLALAEDYPDHEDYEDGINGEYVRMRLGEYLVGHDKEQFGGDNNECIFENLDDPKIFKFLEKNGWGVEALYLINIPNQYGEAWNL